MSIDTTLKEIKPGVFFVGSFDPDLRTFDIIMNTANGTSYNSYLVRGSEGDAIIDTVKEKTQDQFFAALEKVTDYDRIRYVVLNHLEPDHSGALPELLRRAPHAKVVVSAKAKAMVKALYNDDLPLETVKGGDKISLGDKTLEFLSTPFLHWPETMMTFMPEQKILFSCDVFGAHYCDERLFNDEVGDFSYAFKYYYDRIMRPYRSYIVSALDTLREVDFDFIAPSHGPMIRSDIAHFVDLYRLWSTPEKKDRMLINVFYVSSYGNTQKLAAQIWRGLSKYDKVLASMYDLEALDFERGIFLLEKSDAFLVGSPTINNDAVKPVWDFLAGMAYLESKGKKAGVFGSFGWSGEAIPMIQDRLKGLKIKMPLEEPFKIKLRPSKQELADALEYGKKFAQACLDGNG